MAHIVSIVYQPLDQPYPEGHFDDFIRVPVETAVLETNHGIKGDRKAGRNPKRQINLLSTTWLAEKAASGHRTKPGEFGEQIIVIGLDFGTLQAGTQLQLGSNAVVEVTIPRIGCTRLEAAQGQKGLDGQEIGLMVKVIEGGSIHIGDPITIIS